MSWLKTPLFTGTELAAAGRSLKPWQGYLLILLAVALGVSLVGLLWRVNESWAVVVPADGGELAEGVVGTPRFVNPLLAASEADRDLVALIYSGLLRIGPDGSPQPDLAEGYEVSADGLIYSFTLKENLIWHDGEPLTAEDVVFTVERAQDSLLKSPKRASWEGVRVEAQNPRTVVFTLKKPFAGFLENATVGILPKHLWGKLDPETFTLNQFNIEGIGSGPYRVKRIVRSNFGIPQEYELAPFADFASGQAHIKKLRLKFFINEDELVAAYERGEIESASTISADRAKSLEAAGARVVRQTLPRVFAVFFNQNRAALFTNQEVREALNLALNKKIIVETILAGFGQVAEGPLPPGFLPTDFPDLESPATTNVDGKEVGRALLAEKGWEFEEAEQVWTKTQKKNKLTLSFSLATSDTPELKRAAELIKQDWEQLGAKVELKIFELGDLNQNVIRPRQYEALFFGEVLGRRPDIFSFWHSSQRLDPGLNIALYANITVDKLVEKIRSLAEPEENLPLYQQFNEEVSNDAPAVFVYSPDFIYLLPAKVKNVTLAPINTPADRFLHIYEWYIHTDKVWQIFR